MLTLTAGLLVDVAEPEGIGSVTLAPTGVMIFRRDGLTLFGFGLVTDKSFASMAFNLSSNVRVASVADAVLGGLSEAAFRPAARRRSWHGRFRVGWSFLRDENEEEAAAAVAVVVVVDFVGGGRTLLDEDDATGVDRLIGAAKRLVEGDGTTLDDVVVCTGSRGVASSFFESVRVASCR